MRSDPVHRSRRWAKGGGSARPRRRMNIVAVDIVAMNTSAIQMSYPISLADRICLKIVQYVRAPARLAGAPPARGVSSLRPRGGAGDRWKTVEIIAWRARRLLANHASSGHMTRTRRAFQPVPWRRGREAEGDGLLNRYRGNPIVGSNPTVSAIRASFSESANPSRSGEARIE